MTRRILLSLALVAIGVLLASGIALAATFTGNDSDNVIYGGSNDDTIDGKGGADALYGKGGRDTMYGGPGNDNSGTNLYDRVTNSYVSAGMRGAVGNDNRMRLVMSATSSLRAGLVSPAVLRNDLVGVFSDSSP